MVQSYLAVENYFNYFTEIEEHFQRRRGTLLILSPLDWALMETWKDAGIPLEAVLRGIDTSFEKWERRPRRTRKVNGLAYCAQEVLASAEELKEAAVGASPAERKPMPGWIRRGCGVSRAQRRCSWNAQLAGASGAIVAEEAAQHLARPGGCR